jgi:hypothetical protein
MIKMWQEVPCDDIENCEHTETFWVHLLPNPKWGAVKPHELVSLTDEELSLIFLRGTTIAICDDTGNDIWSTDDRAGERTDEDGKEFKLKDWLKEHNLPTPCIFSED